MTARRLLTLITLPVLISMFEYVAQNQAITQSYNRIAQASPQPNQQQGERSYRGSTFAVAAQQVDVSEAALKAALGVPTSQDAPGTLGQGRLPRPDFRAAAAKLGITEQQLMHTLEIPLHRPQDGSQPGGSPPRQ